MVWTAVATALLLVFSPFAAEAADETRTYTRTGSVGNDSDIELYLLEGEYRHEIVSECRVAASLFPGDREPAALLADVLQADLVTGQNSIDRGTVAMTSGGWVNLQVGTGPDCEWAYAITGAFVPLGEEPPPPRAPDDLGGAVGATLVLAAIVVLVITAARSRRPEPKAENEEVVKVWIAPPPE